MAAPDDRKVFRTGLIRVNWCEFDYPPVIESVTFNDGRGGDACIGIFSIFSVENREALVESASKFRIEGVKGTTRPDGRHWNHVWIRSVSSYDYGYSFSEDTFALRKSRNSTNLAVVPTKVLPVFRSWGLADGDDWWIRAVVVTKRKPEAHPECEVCQEQKRTR